MKKDFWSILSWGGLNRHEMVKYDLIKDLSLLVELVIQNIGMFLPVIIQKTTFTCITKTNQIHVYIHTYIRPYVKPRDCLGVCVVTAIVLPE